MSRKEQVLELLQRELPMCEVEVERANYDSDVCRARVRIRGGDAQVVEEFDALEVFMGGGPGLAQSIYQRLRELELR